jgi:hypothetical protein
MSSRPACLKSILILSSLLRPGLSFRFCNQNLLHIFSSTYAYYICSRLIFVCSVEYCLLWSIVQQIVRLPINIQPLFLASNYFLPITFKYLCQCPVLEQSYPVSWMWESNFHIHVKQRANYSTLYSHPSTYAVYTFRKVWSNSSLAQVRVEYTYGQIPVWSTESSLNCNPNTLVHDRPQNDCIPHVLWPSTIRRPRSSLCANFPARKNLERF